MNVWQNLIESIYTKHREREKKKETVWDREWEWKLKLKLKCVQRNECWEEKQREWMLYAFVY